LVQPVSKYINIKTNKKDRKLIIYGNHKKYINNFTKLIYDYRKPSIYTGRGIRQKYMKISYKAGKKDKQKGKSF
jgi:ribosomal protein L6P/L9E